MGLFSRFSAPRCPSDPGTEDFVRLSRPGLRLLLDPLGYRDRDRFVAFAGLDTLGWTGAGPSSHRDPSGLALRFVRVELLVNSTAEAPGG